MSQQIYLLCLVLLTYFFLPVLSAGLKDKKRISYRIGQEKMTHLEAFVACKQSGMELASILSPKEEIALESFLSKNKVTKVGWENSLWLAGTKLGSRNREFVWLNTGKPLTYKKFAAGEPNNKTGKYGPELCLTIGLKPKSKVIGWNDLSCERKIKYICQSSR